MRKVSHWHDFVKTVGLFGIICCFQISCSTSEDSPSKRSPSSTNLDQSFQGKGISFRYPKDWIISNEDLNALQTQLKPQGIDLLIVLKTKGEDFGMSITRQQNSSSFESFLEGKKSVSKETTSSSEEFEKYTVESITLPDIGNAVLGISKKKNGQFGISYQFLSDGYEYDVNFLYFNRDGEAIANSQEQKNVRDEVVNTLRTFK